MKALKDCSWYELLGLLAYGSKYYTEKDIVDEMARVSTNYSTRERPSHQKGKFAPQVKPKDKSLTGDWSGWSRKSKGDK